MTEISRLSAALSDRYVIERELGAGGMATVYLAQDVRHDRKVALKVLRPELSAILGGERFLTEIKTTANLQHPHILSLFDSGEAEGTVFYVMPYVEGESLRDRLTREKQLPVDEAIRTAREVADALDYAHRHGVVHRDIKPENILLHDGRALVADFGIALAASRSEGGTRMTETGMSLGTPHYMSPEQAMGQREITPKADIYALGCVLYEMLTGEPPFTGPTAQAIVARVMTEQPRSLALQRHTVPAHVEATVRKALEKLPADRFASAAQFAEALGGLAAVSALREPAPDLAPRSRPAAVRRSVPWAIAVAALAVSAWAWLARRGEEPGVARHLVTLAESVSVTTPAAGGTIAITADGRLITFVGGEREHLWVRHMDDVTPRPLPGTDGARWPTFSPDGRWIAYVAGTRLFKVAADGGATIALADSAEARFGGIAWLSDNTLVFTGASSYELRRVSAAGGDATILNTPQQQFGGGYARATPLPDARGVLMLWCSANCVTASVQVFDLRTREPHVLVNEAVGAWYLPTGHVLYVRTDGAALAAPFDLRRLELTGPAVPVLQNVQVLTTQTQLAVSRSGTLLYAAGPGMGRLDRTVVRLDRGGRATVIDTMWTGAFNSLSLSPDGRRMAVATVTGNASDIWIKRLDRGAFTRLTFTGVDRRPEFSPDGRTVATVQDTLGGRSVVVRPWDGNGPERVLVRADRQIQEVAWSPDGGRVVLRTDNTGSGRGDILVARVGVDSVATPLVATPYEEMHPTVSPDGRWIAYTSDETGQQEVYVRPFPEVSAERWLASENGGRLPVWSRDGRELFYLADGVLTAARLAPGTGFAVASHTPLLTLPASLVVDDFHQSHAVTPDGRGFVFIAARQDSDLGLPPAQLVLVERWFDELRERMRQ